MPIAPSAAFSGSSALTDTPPAVAVSTRARLFTGCALRRPASMCVVTRPSRPPHGAAFRRDPDGDEQTASSWESLTERLIREAQEAGQFADLPCQGMPLPPNDGHAGEMALAHHVLHNAGLAPPWIEADKQVRRSRAQIEALLEQATRVGPAASPRLRREMEAHLRDHDDAVERLEYLAPTARQQRRRLDRAVLQKRLASALGEAG